MADVIVGDGRHHIHHSHSRSIGGLDNRHLRTTAPKIEMVANPAFSFPMKPVQQSPDVQPADSATRPASALLLPSSTPTLAPPAHKRAASAALPSFSFNASDTSGRHDELTPPQTPDEIAMDSASLMSNRGHRRGGSEFVGGDSRFGVSSAISSSPTKTSMPQLPTASDTGSPTKRRTHAHRRSVAVSSHDLSSIMSAGDRSPRLSSSLPNSPLNLPVTTFERSASTPSLSQQPIPPESRDESLARPVSRPRVEFSEEVEIIPRPLSTISSETKSSMSTVRGHSVNNSISSVLSLGSSSPASPRARGQPDPNLSLISESRTKRSSIELSKRLEREGEWLKSRNSEGDIKQASTSATENPSSGPAAHSATTDRPLHDHPAKRQKRQSLGQTFGFDRRRSEPLITAATTTASSSSSAPLRVSSASLLDTIDRESARPATAHAISERRFSGHRLKQWALSKLHRKSRESINVPQAQPVEVAVPPSPSGSAEIVDVPGKIFSAPHEELPVAETDLDAVFGSVDSTSTPEYGTQTRRVTYDAPAMHEQSAVLDEDDDDASPMLDLDAATEPLRTPPLGSSHHRRQLHSDRPSKQGSSSSNFMHRRAESEPALMSFNYNRTAPSSHKSMEDVFEEDEEEEQSTKSLRDGSRQNEVLGMGITVVDADDGTSDGALSSARRQASRDATRPSTSYISPTPRLLVPTVDRPASLVDEVIVEESSPVEEAVSDVEIVQAHEEPRASSLEKLSDSSEASTLLGTSLATLPASSETCDSTTPTTLQTSAFPSPELWRRQGSFEASRVGTSASSLADTRTTSSCTTGEGTHDMRMSVDDVPSLTSSRSTMMSMMHANTSRREIAGEPRQFDAPVPRNLDPNDVAAKRKKRASIQSLSQLMSGPFGSKTKLSDESRPQTASLSGQSNGSGGGAKKRDNRLKKLMFWRSRQSLRQAALDDEQMNS